jgi:hypothetical protein
MFYDMLHDEFIGYYSLHEQMCCGWWTVANKSLSVIMHHNIDILKDE